MLASEGFSALARRLIAPALREIDKSQPLDDKTIHVLNNRSPSLTKRREKVKEWIDAQRAARFTGGAEAIARVVVDFADHRERLAPGCGYAAILQQFEKLYGRCGEVAPKNKDGRGRDITSLTSKALWVCYPDVVPIYDNYAERALQVISHLMPLNLHEAEAQRARAAKKYAPFLDIWLQLYEQAAQVIRSAAAAANYPYDVRVLDKMLWLIGRPGYGAEKGAQSKSKQAACAHLVVNRPALDALIGAEN